MARADANVARRPHRGDVVRRRSAADGSRARGSIAHAHASIPVAVRRGDLPRRHAAERARLARPRRARVVSGAGLGVDARNRGHRRPRRLGAASASERRLGAPPIGRQRDDDRRPAARRRSSGQGNREPRRSSGCDARGQAGILPRLLHGPGAPPCRAAGRTQSSPSGRNRRPSRCRPSRSSSSTCSRPTGSCSGSTKAGTSRSTTP